MTSELPDLPDLPNEPLSKLSNKQPNQLTPIIFSVERLTRLKQKVEGVFSPSELPELLQHLASAEGEIAYFISGSLKNGRDGGQTRHLKCIIRGLVSLSDPNADDPQAFEIDIESKLVLVSSEAELPPLELESDDEDYVVVGSEIDIRALVIEEVLLFLPPMSIKKAFSSSSNKGSTQMKSQISNAVNKPELPTEATARAAKPSPFAKLADFKIAKTPPTKS
jgi:uncharacterized protein